MYFVILSLATWRISSLLANEQGTFRIFGRIRIFLDNHARGIHEGYTCEWCNSVWIGTLLTYLYYRFGSTLVWIATPLALSTIVILIKYVRERLAK